MSRMLSSAALLLSVAAGAAARQATPPDESKAVLDTVDRVLTALSTNDFATLSALHVVGSTSTVERPAASGGTMITRQVFEPGRMTPGPYREQYWDPIVHVRGSLAVVWAPYEFWLDGRSHHCGIDSFDLVKELGVWKVANLMWTVETDGCEARRPADVSRLRPALPETGQAPPAPTPARPAPPTRDPHTPGFVAATELPDGTLPSPDADGNFIVGPTHAPAPETLAQDGVPQGTVCTFTMRSEDSRIYPGIARDPGTFGTPDPADPAKLVVTTSHPAPYVRKVAVYVPHGYAAGTPAPFIVGADGPDPLLFTTLDNLIAQKRVPAMVAISIGNGSGDAQGSERGLEYDTMSGRYAEFVETEVLPLVERQCHVTLTKDPDARATMGGSSGAAAALIMAWYHPELYHRVLSYSGTYVNQQWPPNPETPHGAWGFHEHLIPEHPRKPIRIWMHVGDRDLYNPNVMRDDMHDWVVANERMAKALADKGYRYQFLFVRNAGHTERIVKQQTLPEALEWLWRDYRQP